MNDITKQKCIEAEDTAPEPDWDAEPLQSEPTPYDLQFPDAEAFPEDGDGKNLVLNSDAQITTDMYLMKRYQLSEPINEVDTYTITVWGKLGTNKRFMCYTEDGYSNISTNLKYNDKIGAYQATSKLNVSTQHAVHANAISIYAATQGVGVYSTIYRIKLEKGGTGTPWTPAPEDFEQMEPETREEMLLDAWYKKQQVPIVPESRFEKFLSRIVAKSQADIPAEDLINDDLVPETRVEKLLDMIYTGDYLFFTPESRVEMFLNAIRKGVVVKGLCPETREEMFLYRLMWQYSYEHKDYSDAISLRFDLYAMPKKVTQRISVILNNISEAEYNDKFKLTAAGYYWARNKEELEAVENYVELAAKNESKQYKVSTNVYIMMSKYNNLAEVTAYFNAITTNAIIPYYGRGFLKYEVDGRKYIYFNTNGDNGIVEIQTNDIWPSISRAVNDGIMFTNGNKGNKFSLRIGDTVDTLDSTTGQTLTWRVVDFDNHKAADPELEHTMTLEMTTVYSDADGNGISVQYDNSEALYYAEEGLTAGTYNFTIVNSDWMTANNDKSFQFTLENDIPSGGQVFLNVKSNQDAEGATITTYASPEMSKPIESTTITEGEEGTSLGMTDGTGNVNHYHRIVQGSNNYAQSALRQWLNSDAEAGTVWEPKTKFNRPPQWNAAITGFTKGLPASFLEAVKETSLKCRTNSVYECTGFDDVEYNPNELYTTNDKFFILSNPEIYGTYDEEEYKDGEIMEYYNGLEDASKAKQDKSGNPHNAWTRSPNASYANSMHIVLTSGSTYRAGASNLYNAVPACIIA